MPGLSSNGTSGWRPDVHRPRGRRAVRALDRLAPFRKLATNGDAQRQHPPDRAARGRARGARRGGALTAAGQNGAGDVVWAATTVAGIGPALFWVASAARERRLGVDVIAVLALLGTLAVGEYLAGAIITVMLASGRMIEARAGARAERDLRALVDRAPRTVHRYVEGTLTEPALGGRPARGSAARAARRGAARRRARRVGDGGDRRIGTHRRAAAGRTSSFGIRCGAERVNAGGRIRPAGEHHGRREHLRRCRAPGRAGRGVERPVRADGGPLRRLGSCSSASVLAGAGVGGHR